MSATLADLTTLRVGGPAARLVEVVTEADFLSALRDLPDALILGGGSNVVIADAGVDVPVILVRTRGIDGVDEGCAGAWLTVAAGEAWDAVVALAVAEEWSGLEALSGIPGLAGATPLQNVGAYGQEVADTIARVRAYDRALGEVVTFAAADCGFAYRQSRFKADPSRFAILSVDFQLRRGSLSAPVQYAELARTLGIDVGERAPSERVREAVLELRRGKGMVLDPADYDTWSTGSFFTNPVVGPDVALPADAPTWEQPDGSRKVSAAWLVEHAGFGKGWRIAPDSPASLSTKHTLALTNRGRASADDVIQLARAVRDGVERAYGVRLVTEPVLVGCSLD